MAEAFVGNWKSHSTEGDISAFLAERGVPLPIRKVLELLSARGEFIFEIKDGKFIETEVGIIKNTVKDALPLDGTPIDTKSPANEDVSVTCTYEDGVLKIVESIKADPADGVNQELSFDGDLLKRKFTNKKSGTTFTGVLARK